MRSFKKGKMKKIVSLVTAAVLTLSLPTVVVAQDAQLSRYNVIESQVSDETTNFFNKFAFEKDDSIKLIEQLGKAGNNELSVEKFANSEKMKNFKPQKEYNAGTFKDIKTKDWFYNDVLNAYKLGLANGKGANLFDPNGNVSIAEAIMVAARIHSIYNGNGAEILETGKQWYDSAVSYAEENGIIDGSEFDGKYNRTATRVEVAYILANAIDANEFENINPHFLSIPDYDKDSKYYDNVLMLYNAGILAGGDDYCNFFPTSKVLRSETMAIINRITDVSARLEFVPLVKSATISPAKLSLEIGEVGKVTAVEANGINNGGIIKFNSSNTSVVTVDNNGNITAVKKGVAVITPINTKGAVVGRGCTVTVGGTVILTAVEIAALAENSVFYIELYDSKGKAIKSGSGFFIDNNGTAVTNYHVIENSYSAKIMLENGEKYNITSVLGYDKELDLAIVKTDATNITSLTLGDSDTVVNGEKVYCVGSPLGFSNTISECIVSNKKRVVQNNTYIQITAPISNGSSGGAMFNEYGDVIGVTSAGMDSGQNLNLSVPINALNNVKRNVNKSLKDLFGGGGTVTPPPSGNVPGVGELKVSEREPNNTLGTAQKLSNGSTVTGKISVYYDMDYYEIDCKAGQSLNIMVAAGSYGSDFAIGMVDSSGKVYAASTYLGDGVVGILGNISSTGKYRFVVLRKNKYASNNIIYLLYAAAK